MTRKFYGISKCCHAEVNRTYPTCAFIKFIFRVTFSSHLWRILGSVGNWNIHTRIFHGRVSLFQFPIKPQMCRQWLEKWYPKDKLNKSTRRVCLIYFSMAQFIDNIKFRWRNVNINDLKLINLHISLITKRFFRSFGRHSDKTVTHSELLLDINKFSNKIVDVIRKSHEFKNCTIINKLNSIIIE